jgi:glutamate synthase domain-containing protein 3
MRAKKAESIGSCADREVEESEVLDAKGVHYKDLNRQIRALALEGVNCFSVRNVFGQRYFGTNLWGIEGRKNIQIQVHGTPGSDLGAFLDGAAIEVFGNVQDATGNTMNKGRIVIHGSAGDVLGYGMRGGEIYVRGNVGYRVGIHMKEYGDQIPAIVIGGTIQDFFGEYMAGGRIIVLNRLSEDNPPVRQSFFIGTGMHGGSIYMRGEIDTHQVGAEVGIAEPTEKEYVRIREHVSKFCRLFKVERKEAKLLEEDRFRRLHPKGIRPYGQLYAY